MQIFGLDTARIKIQQIPHVIFGAKSHFCFSNLETIIREFRRVLFIRSTWKLLFCIFSGIWLKSSYNFISTRSITIADYSDLVYLL